jgi:NitT/TauT family transport system substrate-binding protein
MLASKKTSIVFLCTLAVTLLASTAITRPAEPALRIAVNSTTIESFPVFAAIEAIDAMAANGAASRIQLLPAANGRIAMSQLVGGMADVATGSETQALLNSVTDPRIRIILTLSECRYRIIAKRSAGIRRIEDLRGKRVAVTANTSSHYYLDRMLRTARLNEQDVRVTALEGQDMPAALEKGTVDAVSIWEPHAQHSLEALGNDAVVLEDPSAYTERFNLNTRTDVLMDPAKRAALLVLFREIVRSSARLRMGPPELISTLSPKVGLPAKTVLAVWPQFTFPASLSGKLRTALGEVEPWVAATQTRQPRAGNDLAVLIDSSVMDQALK